MDRIAGLQDLQDRVLMLSRALTMDRITRLQDYRIYRIGFPLAKLGVDNGQDGRIAGFTG